MKKVSLLGLFLLASTTQFASAEVMVAEGPAVAAAPAGAVPAAGCPKAFQGFGLKGIIGYDVGVGRHTFDENDTDDVTDFKTKKGVQGFIGGVGVDYMHRLCNWAVGIGFDALWTNAKGTHHLQDFTFKTRLKNALQLYGKLGYVLRDIAMPFVALGWDNSDFKHSVSTVDAAGDSVSVGHKSKRVNSFLWKVGADFLATKHVVLGFEYTGTTSGNIKLHGRDNYEDSRGKVKIQNNIFALTAKIVY